MIQGDPAAFLQALARTTVIEWDRSRKLGRARAPGGAGDARRLMNAAAEAVREELGYIPAQAASESGDSRARGSVHATLHRRSLSEACRRALEMRARGQIGHTCSTGGQEEARLGRAGAADAAETEDPAGPEKKG